jgi:hypothetical protein
MSIFGGRKMKKLILMLVVSCLVCSAGAATIRYQNSGDWFDTDLSDSIGWQGGLVPGALDTARANWGGWTGNTITLDGAAPTITKFQLGVDESGKLVVGSSGSITTSADSRVGNNNWTKGTLIINGGTVTNSSWLGIASGNGGTKPAGWDPLNPTATWGPTYGIVEVNGGTLNIGGHLWMATGGAHASSGGAPTCLASVTINAGGVINVGGMIGLGTIDAVNQSAGKGTAQVTVNDGGLLALTNIHGAGTSVFPGSMFYLNGSGKITLPGDFTGVMNDTYIPTYVTGDGVLGNAIAELVEGNTVVTVIPEPATLSLLGLGALALLRKRK